MKSTMQAFAFLLLATFSFHTALAQNPQLKAPLTATDLGKVLKVCYDIAGLGNVSQTKLTITYTATVTTQCRNKGGNIAPGQTKTFTGVGETFTVSVSNGRARGCTPTTKIFPAGSCPPGFAGGEITDVTFSNVSVTIAGKTFPVSSVQ